MNTRTASPAKAPPAGGRRRLTRAAVSEHLRAPLYSQGYALVLNAALTSILGLVYWLVAARHYSPHAVGLNAAAISAMMFVAGVAQLNLMTALTRFIPVAGRRSGRFVLSSYLMTVGLAGVAALIFLLGLEAWAPELDFLTGTPAFVLWFAAATMAWCVFNLQDSVLTGLTAAGFVPLENAVYSLAKIGLLFALVGASPHYGIFASWTAALLVSLIPVNLLIFRRLLPRHVRRSDSRETLPPRTQVVRFVSADYAGSLFWLGATALMPVVVVAIEGATANAYYSLAWMIALPTIAISTSTGTALVVAAAADESNVAFYARRVLLQTAGLVIPAAIALALAAPYVLRLFGAEYEEHSATTLTLLALSAIPNVVNILYLNVYRVRRRMSVLVMALGVLCGLAFGLGVLLLSVLGIAGVGLAWLISQSVVAVVQIVLDPRALWPRRRSEGA
jgi:O-antigen/teichoic acid export membrane protein